MSDTFYVDAGVLSKEVRLAREFIGSRVPKPVLQCVKLAVSAGQAQITATDLDVTLTRGFEVPSRNWHRLVCDRCGQMLDTLQPPPIACAVAGCTGTMQERYSSDFLAMIPADHLANIAKECPGALEVESGTLKDEPCVVIRHAQKTQATKNVPAGIMSSEFRLCTQPLEAFPPTAEVSAEFTVIKLGIRDLVEALRWALPALDKNSRWGLVLRQDAGCITVGATNGRVLSIFGGVKAENARTATKAIVMTWKIADRLLEVLEREIRTNSAADKVEIRFEEEKDALCIEGDQWQMTAFCGKVEFPEQAWDITRREDTTYAAVSADRFRKAFKEVAAAVKNEAENLITIAFTDQGLALSADVPGRGTVQRPVGGACRGIRTDVQVPAHCLKDWLKLLPKDDKLGIAAIDRYEPVFFMPQSHNATWVVAGQKRPVQKTQKETTTAAVQEAA